ncbi:MAG: hypothetical protein OR994_04095 [Candidatus Poseidoniales archaeon]|jgi:hypothetical protein|nr:hypothetical protein [Candidatus Poseidoniales archaeon]|tara:strand:+ start:1067 stop:1279 length:213 start_codon:yes stop_codon:yes gene_type:complete
MEISDIVNIFLIIFAVTMFFIIISLKYKDSTQQQFVEEEYTGNAKNPQQLSEPNDDALNELNKLLEKNQL